jgi:hypothetical protein
MKLLFLLPALLASTRFIQADKITVLPNTIGSTGIGIAKVIQGDNLFYRFIDASNQHFLGDLGIDDLSNINIETSWNKPGNRVAALIYMELSSANFVLTSSMEDKR